jgi:signal transduction histidine kinase
VDVVEAAELELRVPEDMISGGPAHGLHVIMRSAMHGAHADFAMVALRVDEERLIIHAGIGPLAEDMVGNLMLVRDSVAAPVLLTGEPTLVADYPERGAAEPAVRHQIGSVIMVPLRADDVVEGALAVGRLAEHPAFDATELDQLAAFVQRSGTARELAGAKEERRAAQLVEERSRIRDDLHDNVIQEIFAASMALQAAADRITEPEMRQLVLAQVEALDATTRRIRSLISDLPPTDMHSPSLPLTKRLVAIVDSFTPALRCLPIVTFIGKVESALDGELARDLEAVLREALSNVARHAAASSVQIRVAVEDDRVVLDVIDNGRGLGKPRRTSGLGNMRRRAERHGGELRFAVPRRGGTHLSWTVPLHASSASSGRAYAGRR